MKKVALLFAAAALLVACADEPKKEPGITQEQKDSIYNALREAYIKQANAIEPEFKLYPGETVIDSAACIAEAEEKKAAIIASADTTRQNLFKAQFNACVKKLDNEIKAEAAAAEKAKEEAEQKANGK